MKLQSSAEMPWYVEDADTGGIPDEFLAAGALPTLHDRYGLSRSRLVGTVLEHLG